MEKTKKQWISNGVFIFSFISILVVQESKNMDLSWIFTGIFSVYFFYQTLKAQKEESMFRLVGFAILSLSFAYLTFEEKVL
ncbi:MULTISPECIES: hypothetical protein [Enterococcus]|uniref:hypothetical protein n=1 Tax=Enterococcus TaxID=1350 RepID=UPI00065E95A3|nr:MULTISPECIES: hypothetical protein [Enterococcus]KAF1303859.1 hypothetical protein BAU16_03230 [Enterococcus sp. JM9B]